MKTSNRLLLGFALIFLGTSAGRAADAAANWEEHCASCHGATGKADTKTGQKLKLKDYSDAKVQAALTDDALLKATLEGVIVEGKTKMKAFGDKLSVDEGKALVKLIRSFKK